MPVAAQSPDVPLARRSDVGVGRTLWQLAGALSVGLVTLVVAAAVVLAGPPLSAQRSGRIEVGTLQQDSVTRVYRVYRPATRVARPGLLIDLHPARANGFLEELTTRFDAHAERLQALVVYPDAVADGWEPYGCCRHPGVDDVAFVSEVIDRLQATDGIDPERVYVTGLSRGGMMAYRLACELSWRLAAIAPVAGNMADERGDVRGVPCQPDRALSVLSIHGSVDTQVPIAGAGRFAPLDEVIARWRELGGCDSAVAVTTSGPVTTRAWQCRAGAEVKSIVIDGAGHTWPGTPLSSVPWGPAAALDATQVITNFFATHTRASATS